MLLSARLKQVGIKMSPSAFIDAIHDFWFCTIPSISVDDFLTDHVEEREFCEAFRKRHGMGKLDARAVDRTILGTILNQRKKGYLSLRDRKRAVATA